MNCARCGQPEINSNLCEPCEAVNRKFALLKTKVDVEVQQMAYWNIQIDVRTKTKSWVAEEKAQKEYDNHKNKATNLIHEMETLG